MKTTSLSIAILLLVFLVPVSVQAQEEDHPEKKSSLEIFFPVCDFLDESQTNWALFSRNPTFILPDEYKIIFPSTVGLNLVRSLNIKGSLRTSLLYYRRPYTEPWLKEEKTRGDIFFREFFLGSFGYQRNLYQRRGLKFSGLVEANLRVGGASIFLYNYFWEVVTEALRYSDLGLSLGFRAEQNLPFNFFVSGESKFTRYVFVHPNPRLNSSTSPQPLLPSQNTLTYQIALGYRF